MKRFLLLFFALLACTMALPASASSPLPAPVVLDGTWKFQLAATPDAAEALAAAKFQAADFDAAAAGFKPIAVPGCWVVQGFEEPHYVNGTTSEGFYLHTFTAPKEAEGRRAILKFGGVWQSAEVWLNGQLLGRRDSGFTEFGFDATKALKPGADNRLAVRVRQQTPTFKFDANDDWALPGIFRSVWLEFTPKDWWIAGVEVVTDFDDAFRDAELRLRVHIMRDERADYHVASPPVEVIAVLARDDGTGEQRARYTATVMNGYNGRDCRLTMAVKEPAPWTAETPNLHRLRVELRRGETVLHTWSDRIGFREVDTAGGVLRLNGRPIKLRGVNRHDFAPEVGRATTEKHWHADLEMMRAANINTIRTSHYPPAEGFVRLCDELGFYLVEEIPYGFGGERMNDPSYAEGAFSRLYETVARDRNRPSIIVWSLGNEDPLTALHVATLRALKGLDPTRPVLLPFHDEEDLPPEADILAPHYRTAADYDAMAAAATRPIITTEYTHALGPEDFGELRERWDALTRHPAGAGGMIWLWRDQGVLRPLNGRTPLDPMLDKAKITREGSELVLHKWAGPDAIYDAHGNLGTDGIVDADLAPQRAYWETRAVYAPVRVIDERVPFAPGQASVRVRIRNDYDFTALSTVSIGWRLLRNAEELARGELRASASPHLEATIEVPTARLDALRPGQAGLVELTFTDAAGRVLTTSRVQLGELEPEMPRALKVPLRVERDGHTVHVQAGVTRYSFDAERGLISAIQVAEVVVARGVQPVVWRAATYCERNQLDRRPVQHPWTTYLQDLAARATAWSVAQDADGVRLSAVVEHRQDEKNALEVAYTYTVLPNGSLRVAYVITPRIELEWLPEIGLEFDTAGSLRGVSWLGYGPGDSLPNRRASALFGQWSTDAGDPAIAGTKSGVAWAHLDFGLGVRLRVGRVAGMRVDGAGDGQRLRLLSHLAGAWTKNGPPERPEWRLEAKPGETFEGAIEIEPAVVLVK
ncbi:MAG: hypothetical protein IAE82_03615 [Opitutaceae bacterium]|nr:hypothetical protein [Opitutaceae bacterium]